MTETEKIVEMRLSGMGYKSIANELNVKRDHVRDICRSRGLTGDMSRKLNAKCAECGNDFVMKTKRSKYCCAACAKAANLRNVEKWNEKHKKAPYSEKKICAFCDNEFVANHPLRKYCSDKCYNDEKYKKIKDARVYESKTCPTCLEKFVPTGNKQIYCSRKCGKKYRGRGDKYKIPYDERLKKCTSIDASVQLLPLVKRDNNTCYLCGGTCDLYDYEVTARGAIITGANYPTIDHVIPVSKGGQHTWDNVKLAHRSCNTKKSDKMWRFSI